jgi:hypothetical protein
MHENIDSLNRRISDKDKIIIDFKQKLRSQVDSLSLIKENIE